MNIISQFFYSSRIREKLNPRGPFKTFWAVGGNTFITTPNMLLGLAALAVLAVISVITFAEQFVVLDNYLKPYSNVLTFFSLIFAFLALAVATFAYKSSVLRPLLTLQVTPLQQTTPDIRLFVDENSEVTIGRPLNIWSIHLANEGEASAKYPMVRMEFDLGSHQGKYFGEKDFIEWMPVLHAHGRGYYGFQWIPSESTIIYPGFSILLPKVYFSGNRFENDFHVTFTFVADGVPSTSLRLPVRVIRAEE